MARPDAPDREDDWEHGPAEVDVNIRGRLVGLGVIALGLIGGSIVYGLWLLDQAYGLRAPTPPGFPAGLSPVISPLSCIVPLGAIGSTLRVLEGVRRVISPD